MPITQQRMIDLADAAKEALSQFENLGLIIEGLIADFARGDMDRITLVNMVQRAVHEQRLSNKAAMNIAREYEHFRMAKAKNDSSARRQRRLRHLDAAGIERPPPQQRISRAGMLLGEKHNDTRFEITAEGQKLTLKEIEELRNRSYEVRMSERSETRTLNDGTVVTKEMAKDAYDPLKPTEGDEF